MRLCHAVAAFVLLAGVGAAGAPAAMAATVSGPADPSATAAAVQSMLDTLLGPDAAVVRVSMELDGASTAVTATSYGAATPAQIGTAAVSAVGGAAVSTATSNAVDGTTTSTSTPAGSLVRETVAVAVDRAALGRRPIAQVRRLIAVAAGVRASRGDVLTVLVAPFPHRTAAFAAAARPGVLPVLPVGMVGALGIAAVFAVGLTLIAAARRPARRA